MGDSPTIPPAGAAASPASQPSATHTRSGRSITEKNRAEADLAHKAEELQQAHDRLKELDRLKSEFFANISHELRTPLSLILGPVRRHLNEQTLDPTLRKDLALVERNAGMLLKQVENLLDLAWLEARGMKPAYARVDLAELARVVASCFESLANDRGISYQVVTPRSLLAEVAPDKVQRVLLNLISNAFKFTPEGGTIRCLIEPADDSVTLVIEDSGPGIPGHLRDAVFDRFRQVEGGATRKVGGTGLGLAIAREFVDLHGGSIELAEATLGGARFEVDLPLSAPSDAEVAERPEAPEPEQGRHVLAELRSYALPEPESDAAAEDDTRPLVLVVEDNPDMNSFLAATLRARYRVASAYNGTEGLEKAKTLHPELIVSDIMMPGMSGDQMIAHMQDDPDLAEIPVLVLTAKADEQHRVELLEGRVQDHLTKPFRAEELLARAGGIIGRRRETIRKLRELNASLEQRVAERTEQVENQADQLRHLAAELNTAEQRVRRRLAQALHDHLQQLLVAACMGLDQVAARVAPEVADRLGRVGRTLHEAIEVSRNLTVQIYPPVLYDRGLGSALRWLAGHLEDEQGIQIQLDIDPAAEPEDQDLQAFLYASVQELLLNVVKHAKTNEAELSMQRQGLNVVITLEDRGVGCAEVELRERPETGGFGLFNIEQRLRVLGGDMTMTTGPGSGCRVVLECPLESAVPAEDAGGEASDASEAQPPPRPTSEPVEAKPLRVMIVDDHRIMREGLNGILDGAEGIRVVAEAADGREAIERIDEAAPDVVIMDVSMPRMDGVEATRWLTREKPDVRVIALSMHDTRDLAEAMIEAGAVRYLAKGGPSDDLVAAIREAGSTGQATV